MRLVNELEALTHELRELRAFKDESEKFTKSLERKLDSAEKTVRKLREKVATLEARPGVIDGIDEEWLTTSGATIEFKRRFSDGSRSVAIDVQGRRRVRRSTLKEALEDASGRQRVRAPHEAQDNAQA